MGTYFSPMLNMHFSDKEQAEKFEKEALLKEQRRQNELLREQNRLMNTNSYNTSYNYSYNTSTDTSFLELLSIISIIPFVLGLLALFALPGGEQAKLMGIKLIGASLICPILQGLIHFIKTHKKQNKRKYKN